MRQPLECKFEADVLAAVLQLQWPERTDKELREHVACCSICVDVVKVAQILDDSKRELRDSVMVPDAGRIWWLAQMRRRREAVKTAGRPILAVQVLAFACALGLLGAWVETTSTWLLTVLVAHGFLVAGFAALVLLVPVSVYLAGRAE